MHNIIKTGSKGNAVIYHNSIMIDCGVTFNQVEPYLYDLQLILLTHEHKDHINLTTLTKLVNERPTLRIGCCEWMKDILPNWSKIDIYEIGSVYDYGQFKISPIKLYHDVPNCGYRILKEDYKIIHATDSDHLDGTEAKGYDLFALEHNYNEDTVFEAIETAKAKGEFSHQALAINSHLSEQQARDFIYKNRKKTSEVIRLHESGTI